MPAIIPSIPKMTSGSVLLMIGRSAWIRENYSYSRAIFSSCFETSFKTAHGFNCYAFWWVNHPITCNSKTIPTCLCGGQENRRRIQTSRAVDRADQTPPLRNYQATDLWYYDTEEKCFQCSKHSSCLKVGNHLLWFSLHVKLKCRKYKPITRWMALLCCHNEPS